MPAAREYGVKPTMSETFGEFLKKQLQKKGWSAEKLAKELSEDGGTVRAWVRGDRVPRLGHRGISQIVNLLDIQPSEKLENLQIESLKQRESEGRRKRIHKKAIEESIDEYLNPMTGFDDSSGDTKINDYRPKRTHGCIKGARKVAETMIAMVNGLPELPNSSNDQILVTFQSKNSIFFQEKELKNQWQKSLLYALNRGWRIKHLIRLDPAESKRTYEVISNSFKFFEVSERYQPRCFLQKHILNPPYGLFLLNNEGLIVFSSDRSDSVDSAIYTRDKNQLEILTNHYSQLINQTTPIFAEYESYEQGDFVQRIIKSDEEPGDRIIFSRRLSEITRPLEWYSPDSRWAKNLIDYLRENSPKHIDVSEHISHRRERAIKLEKYLQIDKYNCRYIYPKSCIENFIEAGQTHPYYFQANLDERIEQLERMSGLLKHSKYEMALLDSEQENGILERIKPSFCEVQGHHVFFMEFLYEDRTEPKKTTKWFLTEERVVVRAFQEYLSKVWNNIADENKNKYYVSEFLQQQIEKLKNQKLRPTQT